MLVNARTIRARIHHAHEREILHNGTPNLNKITVNINRAVAVDAAVIIVKQARHR